MGPEEPNTIKCGRFSYIAWGEMDRQNKKITISTNNSMLIVTIF